MRLPLALLPVLLSLLSMGAALAQPAPFSERDPRYHLQPSDSLEIHYRYSPQFDQTVTVQPDGFASLNLVGDLKLQGLTLDQIRTTLLAKAGERLQDPEI